MAAAPTAVGCAGGSRSRAPQFPSQLPAPENVHEAALTGHRGAAWVSPTLECPRTQPGGGTGGGAAHGAALH